MAWNDPLRRYEMAERLRLLREAEDRGPSPDDADDDMAGQANARPAGDAHDGSGAGPHMPRRREHPPEQMVEMSEVDLRRLIARAVAEAAPQPSPTPTPPPPAPPPRAWSDAWWSPRTGATEHAMRVFVGPDGRALAWVLAGRTGLPLIAVEERQVGSRMGFWVRRHVALDMLDGRCLDVAGPRTRDALLAEVASTSGSRRRVVRLPRRTRWADVAEGLPEPVAARWEESLTEATPDSVDLVATELAARHGLAGGD